MAVIRRMRETDTGQASELETVLHISENDLRRLMGGRSMILRKHFAWIMPIITWQKKEGV